MEQFDNKNILFIAPKFFNYEKVIKEELQRYGAYVDYFDERPSNDFFTKFFIRLKLYFVVNRKIEKHYQTLYDFISKKQYDYIFVISPEVLSYEKINTIKKIQPKATLLLYMWDSFENKNSLRIITLFDQVFSFDEKDVEKYQLKFLPLFYSSEYVPTTRDEIKYDLMFIATAHSDRYKLAKKISDLLQGLKIYYYYYLPSKIMYFFRKYFIPKYGYMGIKDFSFVSLSHEKIVKFFHESKVVLDINHPKQRGLTMRTFECLGAKKKLITTNKTIKNYDFYNDDNILVIDRDDIVIDRSFFNSPYHELENEIYEKYSLNSWLKTIFFQLKEDKC